MFIQTQDTPNPSTVKFYLGQELMDAGKTVEYASEVQAANSPLALVLFALEGVASVFIGSDFVSVSKRDDTDWSMLKPLVFVTLMEHISMRCPVIANNIDTEEQYSGHDSDIVAKIKLLLAEKIRPMVSQDGGDIAFERYESGIVFLRMQGACSGCPRAKTTLKMGVEDMLRRYIPEVLEVRDASQVL